MGLESYEIKETLAQSETTVVRRARRKRDGAPVVVKSLLREFPSARELGQIEFEHRMLKKLAAPGIVRALDLEKDGHGLALIIEDFGGSSLSARPDPVVPMELFFEIAAAVTRALGHVHASGVIHKDVNPANIVVNPATHDIKIIDFGIASELSHEHQGSEATTHLEGTLSYLSPEQTGRMNRDLDYRTDYYSLGVTFFELLTGALPFHADDMMGWVHRHISKAAPSARDVNPAVSDALARVVRKLMAKSPDERYQSAHGLLRDLEICRDEWKSGKPAVGFVAGRHDVPERFQVSQTIFGREQEVATLLRAFEQAATGGARLLLVGGYSGVGKSALIHELEKEIVARHGHFIGGKFDQLERNVPYGALLQAVRALIQQILREPEDRLRGWRNRLRAAVGANGQVLVEILPELGQVLGPQPAVPAVHPREAQVRFQRVFGEFLKAAARPEHPLVLFIDDLQWADPSTPEVLVSLLSDEELEHLLVIGSYRDNEVREGHQLLTAISQIRQDRPEAVLEIALLPLSEASVNAIVADTLRCDRKKSAPLAAVIAQKTGGNPFFVKELLNLLSRMGAFRFVPESGEWEWDTGKIESAAVSDNVVDVMVARLKQLPAPTTEALRLAACLGNQFDLQSLTLIAGKPAAQVAAALRHAVDERVLIPLGGGYRLIQDNQEYDQTGLTNLGIRYQFQHDRVQQAAYLLLSPEERTVAHLRIGRLLLAAHAARPGASDEDGVFEIANHLNLGRALITSLEERAELVRRNEIAARRAKRASAYAIAASHFDIVVELLSREDSPAQPKRLFEARRESIECVYYSGDPERARVLCEGLAAGAPDTRCRVAALELKARILDHQAKLMDAIGTLKEALALMGLKLPETMPEIEAQIGAGIGKMQAHLARVPVEDFVKLPEMTDEDKILINSLLFELVVPSIQAFPPLFVLCELLMFDLALTDGTTPVSCKNFVDCGIIQGPVLGDYDRAYRLGKVAFEFLKRESSKPLAAGVNFVFATFVSPWRAHFRESLETYVETERVALELGDVPHGSYAHTLGSHRWFFIGKNLDTVLGKLDSSAAYLRHAKAMNQLNGLVFIQRAVARLHGSAADAELLRQESDEAFTGVLRESRNAQWLFLHGHAQALASVFLGDLAGAERWHALAREHMMTGGNIQFSLPDHHLTDVLLLARQCAAAPEGERPALLEKLAEDEAKLKKWAENSPGNFAHKHKLACAEIARVRGEPMHVIVGLYGEAVTAAGEDFVHLRALVNERLADYWTSVGQPRIARLFLEEAYFLYERWGAGAKLRQLRQAHPRMFDGPKTAEPASRTIAAHGTHRTTHRTGGAASEGSLDIESMIKATQTISGEVKRDRLFAKLMATIIENAGAQRGLLILPSDSSDELRVEASARVDGEAREPREAGSQRVEDCPDLCADVVRYVARSADTVVLDDASHDPRYREDAHVAKDGVKSLLCLPVLNQGKLVAILYAENNATTHAFTSERLRLLQVIAGQAAISITNARLYDNLEAKVAERTHELMEKNQEIAAMLNSMQQGVFTIDDDLRIQPGYSAHLEPILGTGEIAGKDSIDLLFRDSTVGQDAVAAMRSALQFSFGSPAFLAEVNWVHLVKEFDRRGPRGEVQSLEVDWNPIASDGGDIRKVLVAVRDVTALKELHATAAKNARELDIVGQILETGPAAFQRFCEATHVALREVLSLLRPAARPTRETLEYVFRNMHTVKGNARSIGLAQLVETIHVAEERYVELRANPDLPPDKDALLAGVEGVQAALGEYEEVFRRKLGELPHAQDSKQGETLETIAAIVRDASGGGVGPAQALASIETALRRAGAVSLRELVADTSRMLPSLARELAKPAPTVDCIGARVDLTPAWGRVIRDVLVHAFRNSMDHGIEPRAEREVLGKAPQGRIAVHSGRAGSRIVVRISDDGRGLHLAKLREKLGETDATDEDVANRAFLAGISTAGQQSQVSGRGVGLDAVRSFMRKNGGEARIAFTGGAREGCRPFELVLDLPEDAGIVEPRPSMPPAHAIA